MLKTIFGPYGTIQSHTLMAPGNHGKRAAIVTFATVDEAKWIVENLNGNIPQGLQEVISCNFKKQGGGKGKGGGGKGWSEWGWEGDGGKGGKGGWGPYGDAGGKGADEPSQNVFIGELPGTMDEAQLLSVFGAYGTIESHKLMAANAQGKKAAIMTFKTLQEAQWIVDNLNGNIPQGLTEIIRVNFKRGTSGGKGYEKGYEKGYSEKGYSEKGYSEKGYDGWSDGGKGYGGKGKGKASGIHALLESLFSSGAMPGGVSYSNDEASLFVGGLPRDTTDTELYQMFSVFGAIAPNGVRAMPADDGYSNCRGIGFINFMDPNSAAQAIKTLDGTAMPDGNSLKVSIKRQNDKGKGKGK
eukprot:TRINITY_DN5577_c0_g3_i2.p1 TRINITY_DN5577_c0_g3~~TRINITY_DN5577_c0_g3_i2.p1  ORF type:complete len:395 (-),score=93.64 TRINITY_DN5577_c0_g3_i2:311-1375(-)